LSDHTTLSSLSACQLLPKGMHLSQVLPTELYLRIKLHLDYVKNSMPGWITKDQQVRPDLLVSSQAGFTSFKSCF
jgi:hypothetical protein